MANVLPNILVVDDSAITRAVISRVIGMIDLPIGPLSQASNGREALEIMESTRIDLVLADLNMPVMDGLEMISQMRQRDRLKIIPVVVISAQPDAEQIAFLKSSGVSEYLPKPFTPERVKEAIEPILAKIEHLPQHVEPAPAVCFNNLLAEAVTEALETMAFISPELTEMTDADPKVELRKARVLFSGKDFKGSLSLWAPRDFGVAVAQNCAIEDAIAKADDALKELTNVACGLFLKKRAAGAVGFVLEPPVMGSGEDCLDAKESECATFNADGFFITAHVTPEAHK